MDQKRLQQQMDFILETDKLKFISRQTYLSDGQRKENDAEHSWHLALMALLLGEYASGEVDLAKVMAMVLIHDLVEIDAGDTYAYDTEGNKSKREREIKAAGRLFSILPEDQGQKLRRLWDEFEAAETAEARFAQTLDKVQPMLLNDITGGRAWREHDVRKDQILKRNQLTREESPGLWAYCEQLIENNIKKGNIKDGDTDGNE